MFPHRTISWFQYLKTRHSELLNITKNPQSTAFEAIKLWNVRSGISYVYIFAGETTSLSGLHLRRKKRQRLTDSFRAQFSQPLASLAQLAQLPLAYLRQLPLLHGNLSSPTRPTLSRILELLKFSMCSFLHHKVWRSTDFKAIKLLKGRSGKCAGRLTGLRQQQIKTEMPYFAKEKKRRKKSDTGQNIFLTQTHFIPAEKSVKESKERGGK